MEGAAGDEQRPPRIPFTIDYLLFDKGKLLLEDPEPRAQPEEAKGSEAMEVDPLGPQVPPSLLDKPSQSYIALISTAILSSPEKKLLLSDIYQWIMDKYPYFKNKEKSWRNSVRHNLSLNECFVKAGRSDNGKGHFWAIHPANLEDFSKGDYHRRRARRRIRRMAVNFGYYAPCAFYGFCCSPGRFCLCCPRHVQPGLPGPSLPGLPPFLLPSAVPWPHPFLPAEKPRAEEQLGWARCSPSHLRLTPLLPHTSL